MDGLENAVAIRVDSLGDIARLASTLAARMFIMPVYRFPGSSGSVYMVQTIYKDYYKYYGVPIVYYYIHRGEEPASVRYILARADETGERVELSDRTRTGWVSIPVINLVEKPPYIPDDI
ncbi:MAG: cren protein [Desulfurococcales archaeon]|nr:cren protein [Desulfurococcales archaeon]